MISNDTNFKKNLNWGIFINLPFFSAELGVICQDQSNSIPTECTKNLPETRSVGFGLVEESSVMLKLFQGDQNPYGMFPFFILIIL